MILRKPDMRDVSFIWECYQDWPVTATNPPISVDRVISWVERWMNRDDEVCLIGDTDVPVGLIMYIPFWFGAEIRNLVVHPNHRNQGHSKTIRQLLKDKLISEGIVVAKFKTLPGPIQGKYPDDQFTWDMEV